MTDTPPRVGLVFDDRYLQHDPGLQLLFETRERLPFTEPTMHLSNYRLVLRTKHLIDLTGLGKDLIRVDAYPATDEQIGYYHLAEYIQLVKDISAAGGGDAGRGTPIAENGYEIAALAAGGGAGGGRRGVRGASSPHLRQCTPAWSSRHRRSGHGILRFQ